MIPIIVHPAEGIPVEEGGVYCAGRRYKFEATLCEDAVYVEWGVIDKPPNVLDGDIFMTSPFGIENYITFPVAGEYCLDVTCCILGPETLTEEELGDLIDEAVQEAIDELEGGDPP